MPELYRECVRVFVHEQEIRMKGEKEKSRKNEQKRDIDSLLVEY